MFLNQSTEFRREEKIIHFWPIWWVRGILPLIAAWWVSIFRIIQKPRDDGMTSGEKWVGTRYCYSNSRVPTTTPSIFQNWIHFRPLHSRETKKHSHRSLFCVTFGENRTHAIFPTLSLSLYARVRYLISNIYYIHDAIIEPFECSAYYSAEVSLVLHSCCGLTSRNVLYFWQTFVGVARSSEIAVICIVHPRARLYVSG